MPMSIRRLPRRTWIPRWQRKLANAMELRAPTRRSRSFWAVLLDDLQLPAGARVLEIGCGDRGDQPGDRPPAGNRRR